MTRPVLDPADYFARELADHVEVMSRLSETIREVFPVLVDACAKAIGTGHKLLFFGNGGSAADAQHFATELVVRYGRNRRAIAALALTTDTSALTAIGNDLGFDNVFARQIEALCNAGDVAIGISTSGQSENVILGLQVARSKGAVTVAFTGLVLGDAILDEYLSGECSRISPEAPLPVVRVSRVRRVLGGAANTAANIAALGGRATLVALVGSDDAGRRLPSARVTWVWTCSRSTTAPPRCARRGWSASISRSCGWITRTSGFQTPRAKRLSSPCSRRTSRRQTSSCCRTTPRVFSRRSWPAK
jgi:D-sedoheptulose 7-phosphate isomerase